MRQKRVTIAFLLIVSFVFIPYTIKAQDDYKYEVGGIIGTSFYMGDANKTQLYKNPGLAFGALFRYNKDLRWSIKNNLVIGNVSGNTLNSGNVFPHQEQVTFSRTFYELGSQVEFNFFNYSDKFGYLGAKRMTPYVFAGLGLTLATGGKTFMDINIPIGIGVKYKIKERLNVGFEFSFRKLFSDSFDVTKKKNENDFSLEDPYYIKGSILKNNDWYSLTILSITWDFGTRVCPCLNIE